jgi:hypothetical protein
MSWYNINVLNENAPTEDNNDDTQDSFYERLERLFDQFPVYHIKIVRFQWKGTERRYFPNDNWERLDKHEMANGLEKQS